MKLVYNYIFIIYINLFYINMNGFGIPDEILIEHDEHISIMALG